MSSYKTQQAELKAKNAALTDQIEKLESGYREIPEYMELVKKATDIKTTYLVKVKADIEKARQDRLNNDAALYNLSKSKAVMEQEKEQAIFDKAPKFVQDNWEGNISGGEKKQLAAWSEEHRMFVVKIPGGSTWKGRGVMGYSPTFNLVYAIEDKGKKERAVLVGNFNGKFSNIQNDSRFSHIKWTKTLIPVFSFIFSKSLLTKHQS